MTGRNNVLRHVLLVLVSLGAGMPARGEEKPFFPLTAWDDVRDADTIKKMADCGINLIAFVPPKWLDACRDNGVKAIVFDPRITPAWDKPFNRSPPTRFCPRSSKRTTTTQPCSVTT